MEDELYRVTFNLEATAQDPLDEDYFIAGNTINHWNSRSHRLVDVSGQGKYSLSIMLPAGMHKYRFIRGRAWESLNPEDDCIGTDSTGTSAHRYVEVTDEDLYLPTVHLGYCAGFSSTEEYLDDSIINVYPTLIDAMTTIDLSQMEQVEDVYLTCFNSTGQLCMELMLQGGIEHQIDLSLLQTGMHYLNLETSRGRTTKKIIKM